MNKWELFEAAGQVDNDLLEDAEEFLQRSGTRRPRPWVKWGAMAACLTVAVCALWAIGLREPAGPAETAAMSDPKASEELLPTETQPADSVPPEEPEQITRPVVQVNLNQLDGAPEAGTYSAWLDLSEENFVPMTREELLDYYGVTLPVGEVLPDLTAVGPKEDSGYGRGIYHNESGVYLDTNTFSFESADGVRGVYVKLEMARSLSSYVLELSKDMLAFTTINGWELALFQYSNWEGDNCQYVEFRQNGVTYYVRGKNLDNQEFAAVLEALLEERSDYAPGEPRTFIGAYNGGIGFQTLRSTNADGSVTVETSWTGVLGLTLEEGAEYAYLNMELTPEQAEELSVLSLGDPVAVTFIGEPATIGTVWPQQLVSLEKVEE